MKLSICVQTDEVPRAVPVALFTGTFAERAAKAAAAGADGLELMTVSPRELDPHAIRETLDQHRLAAAAVGSGGVASSTGRTLLHPDPEVAGQARQLLDELIDFTAVVGAPLLTIGSFRGRLAGAGDGARERLADILRQGAERAEAAGVRLALEPANRYEIDLVNNAAEGLAFVQEVGHPALGLLLDTFHVNIEEASWDAPFRRLAEAGKLWHVHIGDNNRLAAGWGMIDFRMVVDLLSELGYEAYLSAELLAKPDGDAAARQTLSFLRPLLPVQHSAAVSLSEAHP